MALGNVMMIDPNSQLLIDTLHGLDVFDGRYEQLQIANRGVDPTGSFTLVFKAWDRALATEVALKFYDPACLANPYRLMGFYKEHGLLSEFKGQNPRILDVLAEVRDYHLPMPSGAGNYIKCPYYPVAWLEICVRDIYAKQDQCDPEDKLNLFSDVLLAVQVYHRREVFIRDLKPDNFRAYRKGRKRIVAVSDLGTAGKFGTPAYGDSYSGPAGNANYAPPESHCGLAGHHDLAVYADHYALGCMLWELFNPGAFGAALFRINSALPQRLVGMRSYVQKDATPKAQLASWHEALSKYAGGVIPVEFDGEACNAPDDVAPQLAALVRGLTHFDYRRRLPLGRVHRAVRIALAEVESEAARRERRRRREEYRAKRLARILANQQRLEAYLKGLK